MERQPVKSSNIKSIGYDEKTQTMEVEFHNSGVYTHYPVTKEQFEAQLNAPSVGRHYNMYHRGVNHKKQEPAAKPVQVDEAQV